MRYNEIIESIDDDDELFGRGLHHRIAAALLAQAEEDQRIADEERGLGDQIHRNVQNAEEFEEQARNYRYIADAFNQSMAQGVKVYRSLDRSWQQDIEEVVDMAFEDSDLDMDFRDYVKQIPESTDDDDLFSTSAKLDRRQELKAKTIRRIEKRDALNIQPGTRLMVKWDNGKYYKGKVVRLTPSGRVIAQVKFHNVGWPLEKNISPRDIKPEHIIKESESDEELFGQEDGARLALKLFKMLRAAVARDPRGVSDMLKQYNNTNSTLEQRVQYTLDYMAQAVGMSREMFDHYSDDFYMMPWPKDVDWRRPWQVWDAQVLDQIIEIIRRIIYGRGMNESDHDDLFSHSVHEEVIYRVEEYKKGLEKHLAVVQQADPEDAEYLEDVINDVNQVLVKLQKNWIAGMDALIQASDSEDWAENIMHELKADNIPVSKYYRAPWQR